MLTQALIKMVFNDHFSEGTFIFSPHCGTHYSMPSLVFENMRVVTKAIELRFYAQIKEAEQSLLIAF